MKLLYQCFSSRVQKDCWLKLTFFWCDSRFTLLLGFLTSCYTTFGQSFAEKKQPLSTKTKVVSFQLSVPCGTISAPSVREVCLRQMKCLRAWMAHWTSFCAKHNTSRRHCRCFTWQSQTSHCSQRSKRKGENIMKAFDNSEFEKHKSEVKEKWGATSAYK